MAWHEAVRLRPAVRQHARLAGLVVAAGSIQSRADGLPALAAAADPAAKRARGPAAARCLHLPLLSARRRVQQRHLGGDADAAQPVDAVAVGSVVRRRQLDRVGGPIHSAVARLGDPVLSRHRDRHHRVQLGRRGPHQRRDDAGRSLRHLRPRGPGHGRALDHARDGIADLQGDEDLSQLRRQPVDLRRRQRQDDLDVEPRRVERVRRAAQRRQRGDRDGGQQGGGQRRR